MARENSKALKPQRRIQRISRASEAQRAHPGDFRAGVVLWPGNSYSSGGMFATNLDEETRQAEAAARSWLGLIDAGDYAQTWTRP